MNSGVQTPSPPRKSGLDTQLLHLFGHRAALGIHAAVEDQFGLGRLDLGQDGLEVGSLVGGVFGGDDLEAGRFGGLLELVGQALAVGGAVVNNGYRLDALLGGELAECPALLDIVGHHTESRLEALLRVFRVGRRAGNLRDAAVGIQFGCGDGRAGIQVADHAIDLGIDQLLGNDGALLRIGGIIFSQQLELDLGAANFQPLGIQFLDGQHGAVFVVLAEVGLRAGHRRHMAELDDHFGLAGWRNGSRSLRLFLLTAGGQGKSGSNGEGNYGKLRVH